MVLVGSVQRALKSPVGISACFYRRQCSATLGPRPLSRALELWAPSQLHPTSTSLVCSCPDRERLNACGLGCDSDSPPLYPRCRLYTPRLHLNLFLRNSTSMCLSTAPRISNGSYESLQHRSVISALTSSKGLCASMSFSAGSLWSSKGGMTDSHVPCSVPSGWSETTTRSVGFTFPPPDIAIC